MMIRALFTGSFLLYADALVLGGQTLVCGAPVDSYTGTNGQTITSYYNGVYTGQFAASSCQVPPILLPTQVSAGQDGEQYQCVEFIRRFYRVIKQTDTSGWHGQYGDAAEFYPHAAYFGLTSYPNNGTVPPQVEDIVGFDPVQGSRYKFGHVAIVKAINDTGGAHFTITLLEQNTNRPPILHVDRNSQSDGRSEERRVGKECRS